VTLATIPFALSYSILISHHYFIIFIAPGCAKAAADGVEFILYKDFTFLPEIWFQLFIGNLILEFNFKA